MAALKTTYTRIQLKNDTEENWNKAINFIPLDGEVIIYDIDESHAKPRIKVGDGKTNVANLPFVEGNNNYCVKEKTLILG